MYISGGKFVKTTQVPLVFRTGVVKGGSQKREIYTPFRGGYQEGLEKKKKKKKRNQRSKACREKSAEVIVPKARVPIGKD